MPNFNPQVVVPFQHFEFPRCETLANLSCLGLCSSQDGAVVAHPFSTGIVSNFVADVRNPAFYRCCRSDIHAHSSVIHRYLFSHTEINGFHFCIDWLPARKRA